MRILFGLCAVAAVISAQAPPSLSHAQMETRAHQGNLQAELRSGPPAWFGYSVKTVRRNESCCWTDGNRGCFLENDARGNGAVVHGNRPVQLEGSSEAAVLFRVADDHIEKVQMYSMECPLDAGGLRFVWLTGVSEHASLSNLSELVQNAGDHVVDGAVFAIAQHEGLEADGVLKQFVEPSEPERLREKTTFWLGASRELAGVETLREVLKRDPSQSVRDKAVFALSVTKRPEGMATLVNVAKSDPSPHVRSQALFWLGQKAGKQALGAISDAIQNDPDTEVKKKAVFALSQLPKDEGVPKLIEVARTQRNPEVRKQAFFWLGQSGDPHALAFFEEVLQK